MQQHDVQYAMQLYKRGTKVEFVDSNDPYTKLKEGTKGIVRFVDGLGTIHVEWEDGSNLGMIPGQDSFKVIEEAI